MSAIPDGFEPHQRKSPVTDAWEPLYALRRPDTVKLGFVLAEPHCNGRGMLHGGVIAALADNAMGLSLGAALASSGPGEGVMGIVTTSLSVDYLGVAKLGQWIEIAPRVVKAGKSSGVVDAIISADGAPIARANASFRVQS